MWEGLRQRPFWKRHKLKNLAMNGLAVPANKCADKLQLFQDFAEHIPVNLWWELSPRLGRVSSLEWGSSANEVTVFSTVYNKFMVCIMCQFQALKKLFTLRNTVQMNVFNQLYGHKMPSSVT